MLKLFAFLFFATLELFYLFQCHALKFIPDIYFIDCSILVSTTLFEVERPLGVLSKYVDGVIGDCWDVLKVIR